MTTELELLRGLKGLKESIRVKRGTVLEEYKHSGGRDDMLILQA